MLYKRSENKGKARWENVGVLIDKDEKKSIKLDLIPVSKEWDGWLVVSERNTSALQGGVPKAFGTHASL